MAIEIPVWIAFYVLVQDYVEFIEFDVPWVDDCLAILRILNWPCNEPKGGEVWKDPLGPLMGEYRVGFPYKKRNNIFSAWRSYTKLIGRSYYLWKWCSQLIIILLNLTLSCTISSLWKEQKQVCDNTVIVAELPFILLSFFPSLPFSFLFWS